MGTPVLAAIALQSLYQAGYEAPLVVTQPDKPFGRGRRPAFSPVKAFAEEQGLAVYQPDSLRGPEVPDRIKEAAPDVIVVAAYGQFLPPAILEAAPLGCLNIHTSLLPAYRGAAPIRRALLNGETETGVSIMKLDEGMDTGPILIQERIAIPVDMDYGGLYAALSEAGARLITEALPLWAAGRLEPQNQGPVGVSYAPRLERRHEMINWELPAEVIRNQIRAFSPSPGASARIAGKEIKILEARIPAADEIHALIWDDGSAEGSRGQPGRIIGALRRGGPVVAAGEGFLILTQMQPSGKKPMDGHAWLNGSRLTPGQSFEGEIENVL